MQDRWEFVNDCCEDLYDELGKDLVSSYEAGAAKLRAIAGGVQNSAQWLWHALQGDWNDERTVGQIAADAVLGMVPLLGQLLCLRDLIANARKLVQDQRDTLAWIGLVLTLIALFPVLGAPAKGALRIIFLYVRRFGGEVAPAVEAAVRPVLMFLGDPKVRRILGTAQIDKALRAIAQDVRALKGSVDGAKVLAKLDELIAAFRSLTSTLRRVLPAQRGAWLSRSLGELERVRQLAEGGIKQALVPVQKILDEVAARLELEAGKAQAQLHAPTNAKTVHTVPQALQGIDPRILSNGQKGLYGEIVSDHFMAQAGHTNLLAADRRVRDLHSKPRGRGIDGVYRNGKPPPPYIVTETKYRTETWLYIESDGTASTELLSMTKGSKGYPAARQMSDGWIKPRINEEFGRAMGEQIVEEGYERWLMLVSPSGRVEQITKLDAAATAIGVLKP